MSPPAIWCSFPSALAPNAVDARFRVAAVCSALPGFRNFRGRVALAVGSGLLMSLENFEIMTRSAPAEAFQGIYFIQGKGDEKAHQAVAGRFGR